MSVGRCSRRLSGVGVLGMQDAGLDTTRGVESVREVCPGAGVLQLLVPGVAVRVSIDHRGIADRVKATR